MSDGPEAGKRKYRMAARAAAVTATRSRILDAAESAADELPVEEITLAVVAERAGVSVQTVLRHYGKRELLLVATVARMGLQMRGDRDVKASWGTERIVAVLMGHYERFGDRVLWMLAQEHRNRQVKILTELGRSYHADWCRKAFAPALRGLRGARRERRLSQLIAATDIYVWKVLRRDRELSQAQVELAVCELLEPLMEPPP
ncbi:MAG TPA: TetR/AcrR family transcriptional regulator [Solirubrobacterales bacterium]|nr:TetR/AcrR family transcriptional regulator [Solirubrobacterales bacterium]